MPTYEYKCDACGLAFEKFHSMTATPVKKCPKCGKNKVRRLISAGAGMIFKGSGFYITDYRDQSYTDKAKAESSASSSSESKPEAKSDTKSESKTDSKPDANADAKPAEKAAPKPEPKASKSAAKPSSKPSKKSK